MDRYNGRIATLAGFLMPFIVTVFLYFSVSVSPASESPFCWAEASGISGAGTLDTGGEGTSVEGAAFVVPQADRIKTVATHIASMNRLYFAFIAPFS